ncbi:hypothetical protein SNEBB_009635 [Seison nebaliae]|nr:hypothetical protein SNEBB_009635 [Seison nebaliae]
MIHYFYYIFLFFIFAINTINCAGNGTEAAIKKPPTAHSFRNINTVFGNSLYVEVRKSKVVLAFLYTANDCSECERLRFKTLTAATRLQNIAYYGVKIIQVDISKSNIGYHHLIRNIPIIMIFREHLECERLTYDDLVTMTEDDIFYYIKTAVRNKDLEKCFAGDWNRSLGNSMMKQKNSLLYLIIELEKTAINVYSIIHQKLICPLTRERMMERLMRD